MEYIAANPEIMAKELFEELSPELQMEVYDITMWSRPRLVRCISNYRTTFSTFSNGIKYVCIDFSPCPSRRVFSTPEELLSCPSYMLVSDSPPSSTASSASTSPSFARRHPPQSHHSRSQHHHGSRHRYYNTSHSSRQQQPQQCRTSAVQSSSSTNCAPLSEEATAYPDLDRSADPTSSEAGGSTVNQSGASCASSSSSSSDPAPCASQRRSETRRTEESSQVGNYLNKEDKKDNANSKKPQ